MMTRFPGLYERFWSFANFS
uniref:Uncharacterized protein n=1 Tax=Arundo donax TaxID=35708 RepID=A0A0A8XR14_ARUDO